MTPFRLIRRIESPEQIELPANLLADDVNHQLGEPILRARPLSTTDFLVVGRLSLNGDNPSIRGQVTGELAHNPHNGIVRVRPVYTRLRDPRLPEGAQSVAVELRRPEEHIIPKLYPRMIPFKLAWGLKRIGGVERSTFAREPSVLSIAEIALMEDQAPVYRQNIDEYGSLVAEHIGETFLGPVEALWPSSRLSRPTIVEGRSAS